MKDYYNQGINTESKLLQKGVLDLKSFWTFVNEKFFKPEVSPNIIFQNLAKTSELPAQECKESKEQFLAIKSISEIMTNVQTTSKYFLTFRQSIPTKRTSE